MIKELKPFIVSLAVVALFYAGIVSAAPSLQYTRTLLPVDSTENVGTSTAKWDEGWFNSINVGTCTGCSGGDTNWKMTGSGSLKGLTPTSTVPVLVGTTTIPNFLLVNDLFIAASSTNNFVDIAVSNSSTGVCATAEFDALNGISSLSNYFSAFGHTGNNFTGSGCANTPYTDFGSNSTYILNPNGNVNFALGTTTSSARFAWYGAGYGVSNRLMTLTQPGYIGLGTNSPDSPITISTVGPTTAIVAPQSGTMIHLASSGAGNSRITGDVYTNGTSQGFVFQGRKARGGVGSPTAVNANDTLAVLGGVGYGTTGFPAISAGAFVVRAEASGSDTSQPTYLSLLTTPTGTITPLERMRINSTGGVLIHSSTTLQNFTGQNATTSNLNLTSKHLSFGTEYVNATSTLSLNVASSTLVNGASYNRASTTLQFAPWLENRKIVGASCMATSTGGVLFQVGGKTNWTTTLFCDGNPRTYTFTPIQVSAFTDFLNVTLFKASSTADRASINIVTQKVSD